jgi:autophagy-related protein 13
VIDLEKPMRCGAFVDRSRIPQYTEQDYNLPETPPFSWLLRKPKSEAENKTDDEKLSKSQNDENSSPNNIIINNNNNLTSRVNEASKLSQSPKDNISGTSPSSLKSRWSVRENKEDDKLLKELVSSEFPYRFA